MGDKTGIEYLDATWNPVKGCSHASSGCDNCWAEWQAARFGKKGEFFHGLTKNGSWTGEAKFYEKELLKPIHWKRPRRIGVCFMGDLFHESVDNDWIAKVFAVMAYARQHQFLVLTKRPERMLAFLKWAGSRVCPGEALYDYIEDDIEIDYAKDIASWPLPNLWLGVSVENQQCADERIPLLLQCPAAVRFVSVEPFLSAVDLHLWLYRDMVADGSKIQEVSDERKRDCVSMPGSDGGLLNRRSGSDLASQGLGGQQEWYPVTAQDAYCAKEGGTICFPETPQSLVLPRQEKVRSICTPGGLACGESAAYTGRPRDQPQRWEPDEQPTRQYRGGYSTAEHLARRADTACLGHKSSERGAEHGCQTDVGESDGDSPDVARQEHATGRHGKDVRRVPGDHQCRRSGEKLDAPASVTSGIGWVVCGGESGPGARPTHPLWVYDLQRQCEQAWVPFYFKQWGEWMPVEGKLGRPGDTIHYTEVDKNPRTMRRVGKTAAGNLIMGKAYQALPIGVKP